MNAQKKNNSYAATQDTETFVATADIDGAPIPVGDVAEAEWKEICEIISGYYGEWTDTSYPGATNNRIPNTALLGNGDVGISSDGDDNRKSFNISKSDFWEYNGGPLKAGTLSVGQYITEGNPVACDGSETEDDAIAFYEKLDILNARIVTTQQLAGVPIQIESWLSATSNLFVMEITSLSQKKDAEISVRLNGFVNENRPVTAEAGSDYMVVTRSTRPDVKINLEPMYETTPYVSTIAMATKVIGAKGIYKTESNDSALLTIKLAAGKTVYVVTAIGGGGRTYTADGKLWEGRIEPISEAIALLDTIKTDKDVKTLQTAHRSWWKKYWMQSYIRMDTSDPDLNVLQKYYYAAQYELGAGVRPGKVAVGLYGIWHTTDTPSWCSDYHLNYNFIATFYGLATSNRPSMLMPAVDAIMDYIPIGIKRAKALGDPSNVTDPRDTPFKTFLEERIRKGDIDTATGIPDAIIYPVGIMPYQMTRFTTYHCETLNAPMSAYPMVAYYNCTQDKTFMENALYVYIRYILNFLEHWLVREEDGSYVLYAGFCEGTWAKNAILELGAYKMCLQCGIRIAKELGDTEKAEKWQDIYDNMADLPLLHNYKDTGKTILGLAYTYVPKNCTDWQIPADVGTLSGGNAMPLESIFPFDVLGYYSSDDMLKIMQNTVEALGNEKRNSWEHPNSFPKIYVAAVNSRYDCKTIVSRFADTIRKLMRKNMIIDDNGHGIEKVGATEAINQMMLLCNEGVIKLFGNWLTDKDASFTRLRAAGAFVVSAKYNGRAEEIVEGAVMYSEAGATATVASLWKQGMRVLDENGREVVTVKGTAPNHEDEITYTFATEKGKTYTFVK